MTKESLRKEAIEKLIEHLEEGNRPDIGDLHNEVFNEDYYIIGTARAKGELNEYGVFEAIQEVKDYEVDNFGEFTTEIEPESIANMLFYIAGYDVLTDLKSYYKIEGNITDKDAKILIKELKSLLGDQIK